MMIICLFLVVLGLLANGEKIKPLFVKALNEVNEVKENVKANIDLNKDLNKLSKNISKRRVLTEGKQRSNIKTRDDLRQAIERAKKGIRPPAPPLKRTIGRKIRVEGNNNSVIVNQGLADLRKLEAEIRSRLSYSSRNPAKVRRQNYDDWTIGLDSTLNWDD